MTPINLTLDTHMDNGWMYHVYRNQTAAFYLSLISVSPMFKIKNFLHIFLRNCEAKKFKLGTFVDNGWMYRVYQNQAAATYLSLYFFIFLSLQLSNIYNFLHILSGTVRPRKLKLGSPVDNGCMYSVYRN